MPQGRVIRNIKKEKQEMSVQLIIEHWSPWPGNTVVGVARDLPTARRLCADNGLMRNDIGLMERWEDRGNPNRCPKYSFRSIPFVEKKKETMRSSKLGLCGPCFNGEYQPIDAIVFETEQKIRQQNICPRCKNVLDILRPNRWRENYGVKCSKCGLSNWGKSIKESVVGIDAFYSKLSKKEEATK